MAKSKLDPTMTRYEIVTTIWQQDVVILAPHSFIFITQRGWLLGIFYY